MSNYFAKIMLIISFFLLTVPYFGAKAQEIDYNNIISDAEAQDFSSFNQVEIKNFLQDKNSYLSNYWYFGNNPGPLELSQDSTAEYFKERSATEIIYNAAQEAKISPKFLLTMLQKEQGLIENPSFDERGLDFSMGYYCFDGSDCNPRFKGFGKQVRSAALQFRWYIDNIEQYDYQPNKKSCIDDHNSDWPCTADGVEIQPANRITAALYVYTPHIHGNKLFATLWNRYGFGGSTPDIISGIFPEGSLLKAKDGNDQTVYLVWGGQRLALGSMSALVSRFDPNKILSVSSEEINKYAKGPIISYVNYSVVKDPSGNRYLIDGLNKRLIVSDEAFRQLGYNPDEIVDASEAELTNYSDGEKLTGSDLSPKEEILQDMTTKEIFYVKNSKKYAIIDNTILKANYSNIKTKSVTSKTLDKYEYGGPVKLLDGTLIKKADHKDVFVVSGGERRLIPDGNTFETLGYKWTNIITVPNKVLNLHPIGPALSL